MLTSFTLFTFALLGLSAASNKELARSKRQFIEVDSGDLVPSYQPRVVYRYGGGPKWVAAADPYFSGISSPTIVAQRPTVYYQPAPVVVRRPIYRESVQYVPVRSLFRAKQIVYERPVTTVIERPARVLTSIHPSPVYMELEKRRRMMAKKH